MVKENKQTNPQVISLIVKVIIFELGAVLAIIFGVLAANFYPKLDLNEPWLIKAYHNLFSQESTANSSKTSIKNSMLFDLDETAISPEGEEQLNQIIKEIETREISTIRIASYTDKPEDSPLKLSNLVKQYLEANLSKKYRMVLIGYPLTEAEKLDTRIEFWLN
jgi:hypothetical protein